MNKVPSLASGEVNWKNPYLSIYVLLKEFVFIQQISCHFLSGAETHRKFLYSSWYLFSWGNIFTTTFLIHKTLSDNVIFCYFFFAKPELRRNMCELFLSTMPLFKNDWCTWLVGVRGALCFNTLIFIFWQIHSSLLAAVLQNFTSIDFSPIKRTRNVSL